MNTLVRSLLSPLGQPSGPIRRILAQEKGIIVVVGMLGLLSGILDGVGIGLLVPFAAIILTSMPDQNALGPFALLADIILSLPEALREVILAGVIIMLFLLKTVTQASNNALVTMIEGRIEHRVRTSMAERLVNLPYQTYLTVGRARFLRIIESYSWAVGNAARAVITMLPAFAALSVFAALLIYIEARLFTFIVFFGLLILLVFQSLIARQKRLSRALTPEFLAMSERDLDLIDGARVIRVYGGEARELDRYKRTSQVLTRSLFRLGRLSAVINPLIEFLIVVLVIILVLTATSFNLSAATTTTFLLILLRSQPHIMMLSRNRSVLVGETHALEEVRWLLSQTDRSEPAAQSHKVFEQSGSISFSDVSYAYPDGTIGLQNVSLEIPDGTVTAVLGQSGSGKTTLINLLCRLVRPQSGLITFAGHSLDSVDPANWRSQIGTAGQDIGLMNGTIRSNILYGRPDASEEELLEAASVAGAAEFIAQLPEGFDTVLHESGLSLSGGQRQRIALARALIRKPLLLILDEATNAVDTLSENEIIRVLGERNFFRSALIISHRPSTLAHCEQGIVLRNGRVVEAGKLDDLDYFSTMFEE